MNRKQRRAEKKSGGPAMRPASPAVQAMVAAAFQHHQSGRLNEAEILYRRVLAVDPRHADSLHLLGVIAHQNGHYDVAVDLIGKAIAVNANASAFHSNLGNALTELGRLDEAVACFRAAIGLTPDFLDAHRNFGHALLKQGRPDEAEVHYRWVLDRCPDIPSAHNNLGAVLAKLQRLAEAVACYRRALDLEVRYPDAHNNLGAALAKQGRLDDAVACYRRAIELAPDYPDAHNNLGAALVKQGRLDDAVACHRRAIELKPDYPDAYSNLGGALATQGRLDDAVACYRRALELGPQIPGPHLNLALILLARGEFAAGWAEYEWRWKTLDLTNGPRPFAQPQWHGEPAAGRTLLIHAEQGFGDTIQFCRYAPLAAERGLRVVVEVQKPLVRLLGCLPGVDRVFGHGEDLPPFDLHCPMLSLPLAMGTTLATIPAAACYLQADPLQVAVWRTRLAAISDQGSRIGLVWAGSSAMGADWQRSLPPDRLAPLFDVPGVHFFSLQKDGPAAPTHLPLSEFMAEMDDFADTAALIANLDLVIAVDTSVAHLAAALGKPVWLLDRFAPCWRWLLGRRDSPWYPTLRLYRQPEPGDWDSVVAEIVGDLRSFAGK